MAEQRSTKAGTPARVAGYRHGRVPRAIRERQLLDHAERLFVERGYSGVSIEDICRAGSVSRPMVYDYFGTKDGIYLACLRRIRDELDTALISAAANAPDLASAIRLGAEAFFGILRDNPQRWSLVYEGNSGLVGEPAEQLYTIRARTVDHIAAIAARFAPGSASTAVTAYAHAISGAGEQLGRWWLHQPELSLPGIIDTYLAIALGAFDKTLGAGAAERAGYGELHPGRPEPVSE